MQEWWILTAVAVFDEIAAKLCKRLGELGHLFVFLRMIELASCTTDPTGKANVQETVANTLAWRSASMRGR